MAEGQQQSFCHHLFCLLGFPPEAMYHPRLCRPTLSMALLRQFLAESQQFVESLHTMYHHRLLHRFRNGDLSTESLNLYRKSVTTHFIQSALSDGPHTGRCRHRTHFFHFLLPIGRNIPRMQPHRKGYVRSFMVLPEQEIVGTAIEDARHIVRMMGVEIEHG